MRLAGALVSGVASPDVETLNVSINGSDVEAIIARPEAGRGPGVLMFMDAIGLRPQIEQMARRYAAEGYVVLAPNLFFRSGGIEELMPQGDLRAPGEREKLFAEIGPRLGSLTPEIVAHDAADFVDALRAVPGVAAGPVGVVGYCMGARYSTQAAGQRPDDVAASAGFHGARLVIDEAGSPHEAFATAKAEFVFGHADNDPSMPAEAVQTLGEAMAAAQVMGKNEVYPDAPHGFTMADTSMYQEAGAERAFAETKALFARTLMN